MNACQRNEGARVVTGYTVADISPQETDRCFENFETVVTLSLSTGIQIGDPFTVTGSDAVNADLCCNEGVDSGDLILRAQCADSITT